MSKQVTLESVIEEIDRLQTLASSNGGFLSIKEEFILKAMRHLSLLLEEASAPHPLWYNGTGKPVTAYDVIISKQEKMNAGN